MVKLDIGSGPNCREGFEGVDAIKYPGVKYVMDALSITDWQKIIDGDKIEEIVSYGFLEHLSMVDAKILIKNCYIALEEGGRVEIEVPDLEWSCKFFLENPGSRYKDYSNDDRGIVFIYGMQNNQFEFHKSGYTQEYLELSLKQAGFKRVVVKKQFSHAQGMLLGEGYK